jgi:hypothetical protein
MSDAARCTTLVKMEGWIQPLRALSRRCPFILAAHHGRNEHITPALAT